MAEESKRGQPRFCPEDGSRLRRDLGVVELQAARIWLDEGTFHLVSPLDSENQTEVELSEEHEAWLEWMVANSVEHVRLA